LIGCNNYSATRCKLQMLRQMSIYENDTSEIFLQKSLNHLVSNFCKKTCTSYFHKSHQTYSSSASSRVIAIVANRKLIFNFLYH